MKDIMLRLKVKHYLRKIRRINNRVEKLDYRNGWYYKKYNEYKNLLKGEQNETK